MTLLSKMEVTSTGYRSIDRGELQPIVQVITEEAPSINSGYSMQTEYILSAKFAVFFRANNAQFEDAKQRAKVHANRVIFGDMINQLGGLLYLIHNDQKEEALAVVENLLQEINDV